MMAVTVPLAQDDDDIETGSVQERTEISKKDDKAPGNCRNGLIVMLIALFGATAACVILYYGVNKAVDDQKSQFDQLAAGLFHQFETAWQDYEVVGLWVQESCRSGAKSRLQFSELYDYLRTRNLDFQAMEFVTNVTDSERLSYENETRAFYEEFHPEVEYEGITGYEEGGVDAADQVQSRSRQPFYFPIQFLAPFDGNEAAVDFDLLSSSVDRGTIEAALESWQATLTERQHGRSILEGSETSAEEPGSYYVRLIHPGVRLPSEGHDVVPQEFSSLVISIRALFIRAVAGVEMQPSSVYLFDATDPSGIPMFLGGATISHYDPNANQTSDEEVIFQDDSRSLEFLQEEAKLSSVRQTNTPYIFERHLLVAGRDWVVLTHAEDGSFSPDLRFIMLGSGMIFFASGSLAFFLWANHRRMNKMNSIKSAAESEKAALMVRNAEDAARAERELNDFIAHEVRNPLSAAISACSFVKAAIRDNRDHEASESTESPAETTESVQEDMGIIDNSLHFINDLLRSMLDMQRAARKQLTIELSPTDILSDILEPVASMLYRRDNNFEVLLDCPKNMVVMADRLRLKQVILNLGRNATKFVDTGFIRLRAELVDEEEEQVRLYVEDSGPGIPTEKRAQLFRKFQESLDSLSQGTGIGLSLSQNLVKLMGGTIRLDEDYVSGVENCPGARFVICLKVAPLPEEATSQEKDFQCSDKDCTEESKSGDDEQDRASELPEDISVLFVDDDFILRRLFSRSIRKVAPSWKIQEASNGETALLLVKEQNFDLIFLDQYMASVDKQLLGTETARALRADGVTSTLCGLSANDLEGPFLKAGADAFMMKPFPCEAGALKNELGRILHRRT